MLNQSQFNIYKQREISHFAILENNNSKLTVTENGQANIASQRSRKRYLNVYDRRRTP